jgi:hypothetical protein
MILIPVAIITWGLLLWGLIDIALFFMKDPW